MQGPGAIHVPTLNAGDPAEIRWDAVGGATSYTLTRSVDGAGFQTIYSGPATSFTDSIPSAHYVEYRVRAHYTAPLTWAVIEAQRMTFQQWDDRGGFWKSQDSEWTTSGQVDVYEDIPGAVFYVLRDGVPVARLTSERSWVDYMAVGTHRYIIRGVDENDNPSDSNEVIITLNLNHAVISPADSPGSMFNLDVRRGDRPETIRALSFPNISTMYFEGREKPVIVGKKSKSLTYSLAFTHLTLEEYEAMDDLLDTAILYRDHFNKRIFAEITSIEDDQVRRHMSDRADAVVDFTAILTETEYDEAIEYD